MLNDPMLDPTGALIVELRADSDVATLVGTRVAAGEVPPGWGKGAGSYIAFVILIGAPAPFAQVPVTRATYNVRCYGSTFENAGAVWGAVVKALHKTPPRVKGNGLGFYRVAFTEDADQLRDIDTKQPYVEGTLEVTATAQAVA